MFANPLSAIQNSLKRISEEARASLRHLPTFGGLRTIIWAAVGLLVVSLGYLAQSSNAALIAHDLNVKEAQIEELEKENAQLRYEIASSTSPVVLEERAQKLGLGPAKHVVYTTLPALPEDETLSVANLPVRAPDVPLETVSAPTIWEQVLAFLGLNHTGHAQAQSK